jgi:hypothetical protein
MISARAQRIIYAVVVLVAIVRIVSTYRIFSETADEGMHLSAGLELLTDHHYGLHLHNPPLPRAVIAFVPWMAGARWDAAHGSMDQVLTKFHSLGSYRRMLVMGRVGTLLFFLLATLCTAWWARREIGEPGALLATILFTTQPSILAHSALATVDVAGTAGFALALVAFSYWLEQQSLRNAVILGLAYGFAIMCKLLCIAYVPAACGAIYVVRLVADERTRTQWRRIVSLLIVPVAATIVVWAGYGFSWGKVGNISAPAPGFWNGVIGIMDVNREGFQSYAFGQASTKGWWWYFLAALALKTTLGFLLLLVAGLVSRGRAWIESLCAAAAILLISMPTHVDIGIRYILPIYVPLSVAAAGVAVQMLGDRRRAFRVAAVALLTWHLGASFLAHPDYLAYFNELGGPDPSRYLIDSNLDWGQDVLRLRDVVRQERIDSIALSIAGMPQFDRLGFPPHYYANPFAPVHGWLAVSDHSYRMAGTEGGWRWLRGQPYRRIGKSIRLYDLP